MRNPPILTLLPCPFCGGPPVASVFGLMSGVVMQVDEVDPKGESADAYVWCHECGAQGTCVDGFIYDRDSYYELELQGAKAWNDRNSRHADLYEAGHSEYPRE